MFLHEIRNQIPSTFATDKLFIRRKFFNDNYYSNPHIVGKQWGINYCYQSNPRFISSTTKPIILRVIIEERAGTHLIQLISYENNDTLASYPDLFHVNYYDRVPDQEKPRKETDLKNRIVNIVFFKKDKYILECCSLFHLSNSCRNIPTADFYCFNCWTFYIYQENINDVIKYFYDRTIYSKVGLIHAVYSRVHLPYSQFGYLKLNSNKYFTPICLESDTIKLPINSFDFHMCQKIFRSEHAFLKQTLS